MAFFVRRVSGDSMTPALRANDVVIVWSRPTLHPGDIIVVSHNGLEKIKRLDVMDKRGVYILGDNPARSTDSRHFGWLPTDVVRGKVIWPRR